MTSNELALGAFRAGAGAFLVKSQANKMLLAAVESLIVHKPFFFGVFSSERMAVGKRDRSQILTLREETVVKLVAEGYSNKKISRMLNLSIKTTETHRAAAMRKLGVRSVAGLVRYAVRNNFMAA
jgi:DNA-binding NarL/FixJ family response regulator